MRYFYLTALLSLFIFSGAWAQHKCSTPQEPLIERIMAHKKNLAENPQLKNPPVKYLPIKFHRIANTEGNQRIPMTNVLDNLCRFNQDYEPADMVAYINNGFNEFDNSVVFQNPGSTSALAKMRSELDDESINIFIPFELDTEPGFEGQVLGYYDPSEDWVVIRQAEFIDSSATMSHEVGHFLSLMHPFFGWEPCPYDPSEHGNPVTDQNTCTGIAIELMDGTNCDFAGDRLCDTPPSYLFGFSQGGGAMTSDCSLVLEVFDRNLDKVEPMENNVMDYFDGCDNYEFTTDQIEMMHQDFNSPSRAYIRSSYVPNLNKITQTPDVIYPNTGDITDFYNSIYFDWTEVEHADNYLVEITNVFTGEKTEYISSNDGVWVNDLEPNTKYAWFVHPFNETSACTKTSIKIFDTGGDFTDIDEISSINDFSIYPNPVSRDEIVIAAINGNSGLQDAMVTVTNSAGQVVQQSSLALSPGDNQLTIDNLSQGGVYLVQLVTKEGTVTKKLFVH